MHYLVTGVDLGAGKGTNRPVLFCQQNLLQNGSKEQDAGIIGTICEVDTEDPVNIHAIMYFQRHDRC